MPLPDFETLALDRFLLCNQEIIGSAHGVYRLPPIFQLDLGDLPALMTRPGPMRGSIPSTVTGAGRVEVTRDYYLELFAAPRDIAQDIARQGADALAKAVLYFNRVRTYYMAHPRLNTDGTVTTAKSELVGVGQDVLLTDSGLADIPGPGGINYLGVRFTVTLTMFGLTNRIS